MQFDTERSIHRSDWYPRAWRRLTAAMLIVDLIAAALIVSAAVWGIRAGAARVLLPAAFAAGAAAAAHFAPQLLAEGHNSDFALAVAFPAALLAGAIAAALVDRWGPSPRRRRRGAGPDVASAAGGGLLAGAVAVAVIWLLASAVMQVSPLRDRVADSTVVGEINDVVRSPGPDAAAEDRPFVPFPVVAGAGPPIAPLDPRQAEDADILRADRSVAKIAVQACGSNSTGSGWLAADGVMATNAHVAAAAEDIRVRLRGRGRPHAATTIWFDPVNDVALLRVPGLRGARPLPIARSVEEGASGAVIGFPGGEHMVRPARLGPTTNRIRGEMSGDLGPEFPRPLFGRLVTTFRGVSGPGGSGGPIVDARGHVMAMVFGGRGLRGRGLGVPIEFVRKALREARGPVRDNGTCPSRARGRAGGRVLLQ